jgi:hypothetical protein
LGGALVLEHGVRNGPSKVSLIIPRAMQTGVIAVHTENNGHKLIHDQYRDIR